MGSTGRETHDESSMGTRFSYLQALYGEHDVDGIGLSEAKIRRSGSKSCSLDRLCGEGRENFLET